MNNSNIYDVIIIGAGISGIIAGKFLHNKDLKVKLIDKGKAIGGRLATRRIKYDNETITIDYGCKYLEIENNKLLYTIVKLIKEDILTDWHITHENKQYLEMKKTIKLIGRKSMRDIAIKLAEDLDIASNIKITKFDWVNKRWILSDEKGNFYESKQLLLTMPIPQSLELIKNSKLIIPLKIENSLIKIKYKRSIVAILLLDGKSKLDSEGGIKFNSGPISFITDNNLKGINKGKTAITVEMSERFSEHWWSQNESNISSEIIRLVSDYTSSKVIDSQIHKWKYSTPKIKHPKEFEFTGNPGPLYFAGDAFKGENAEAAFLSGLAAAEDIYNKMNILYYTPMTE